MLLVGRFRQGSEHPCIRDGSFCLVLIGNASLHHARILMFIITEVQVKGRSSIESQVYSHMETEPMLLANIDGRGTLYIYSIIVRFWYLSICTIRQTHIPIDLFVRSSATTTALTTPPLISSYLQINALILLRDPSSLPRCSRCRNRRRDRGRRCIAGSIILIHR